MRKMRLPAIGLAFLMFAGTWAGAWPITVGSAPTGMATDQKGNVLAAIPVRLPRFNVTYAVAKLDGIDGHSRWRHRIDGTARNQSTEVNALVSLDDDTVVTGSVVDTDGIDLLVTRLAGSDGHERWRTRLRGVPGDFRPIYNDGLAAAVDRAGDVLVAGSLQNAPYDGGDFGDFVVAKLDGATGSERWRFRFPAPPGTDTANVIAADRSGDVVAGGRIWGIDSGSVSIVKLSGPDGHLVWRRDLETVTNATAAAIDPHGDVLLSVSISGSDFGVVKLAGTTGEVLWIDRESASANQWEVATQVIVDPSGGVFAAGMVDDGAGSTADGAGEFFEVVRLDGNTGTRVWAYSTTGSAGGGFSGQLQLSAQGLLFAGGTTRDAHSCGNALVVALDPLTGSQVWSRSFDGTRFSKECEVNYDVPGPAPPIDDDDVGAMTTDGDGGLFVGLVLTNQPATGARTIGSIRRLSVRR
jgi:hypothetical protein